VARRTKSTLLVAALDAIRQSNAKVSINELEKLVADAEPKDERLVIMISTSLMEAITQYQFENRCKNRASAIRELLEEALTRPKPVKAKPIQPVAQIIPDKMKSANERRSIAQKARWAKIRAEKAAEVKERGTINWGSNAKT